MARYSRMIFHASMAIEKAIYKILNDFPNKENVLGGGISIYSHEVTPNQIMVGISA